MKFVGIVAALMLSAAACSSSPDSSAPTTAAPLDPRITEIGMPADRPLRVLVVGDDVIAPVGVALADALSSNDYEVSAQTGDFLVEYADPYDPAPLSQEWEQAVRDAQPDVVVVTNLVATPITDCVGTASEIEECERYAADVGVGLAVTDMVDTLSADGAKVVWVDYPVLEPAGWAFGVPASETAEGRASAVNAAVRAVAETDGRLQVFSTRNVLGTSFERHQRFNDGWWEMRNENGVTLCQKAAEAVTVALLDQLLADPPRFNSWAGGDWRSDDVFAPGPLSVNGCSDTPTTTQPD